jgi:hypothetical protein
MNDDIQTLRGEMTMPNWYMNYITVHGPQDEINRLKAAYDAEFVIEMFHIDVDEPGHFEFWLCSRDGPHDGYYEEFRDRFPLLTWGITWKEGDWEGEPA